MSTKKDVGSLQRQNKSQQQGQQEKSENWLIEKSLQCLADGKAHEARAWILTAKSLYPKDFKVQHGLLQMQITAGQLQDAAVLLSALMDDFPKERLLWEFVEEMMNAVESVRQSTSLEQVATLASLFGEMDDQQQKKLIMRFAEHVRSDTPHYCRVLMLLMRLHPDTVQSCAMQAISSLAESLSSSPTSCEAWRTLVIDLLPTVLSSRQVHVASPATTSSSAVPAGHLSVPQSTMYKWLDWTLHYYVDVALARPPSGLLLLSPTSSRSRRLSLDGQMVESGDGQPWRCAWQQMALVADLCQWSAVLGCGILEKGLSLLEQSVRLQQLVGSLSGTSGALPPDSKLPVFYVSVLVWLEACCSYSRPPPILGVLPSNLILLDLPQAKRPNRLGAEPPAKRSKPAANIGDLPIHLSLHPDLPASCSAVLDQFQAAYRSWHLLTSIAGLESQYRRVLSEWSSEAAGGGEWSWLAGFRRDVMLYTGDTAGLSSCAESAADSTGTALQCSFAMFVGGQQEKACRQILKLFNELPDDGGGNVLAPLHRRSRALPSDNSAQEQQQQPRRELQLTPCTSAALVPLLTRMLVCYYEGRGVSAESSDAVLGNLVVLCQCSWPEYAPLFSRVAEAIYAKKAFSYPQFFDYVVNVDILEEMSFLHNCGCSLVLLAGNSNPAKRTVTRGVNKGAKEEIRLAIERQVVHVDSSSQAVTARLVRFLKETKLMVK